MKKKKKFMQNTLNLISFFHPNISPGSNKNLDSEVKGL